MSLIKNFIFIIFITTFCNLVNAEGLKKMGTHKDWETYVIKKNGNKVCFAQSKPILQAPKENIREARLFITFRPKEKITNEPTASITTNQENEKVNEIEARKNITIKISDPATPKILERFIKTIEPTMPPEDSCGK